MVVLVEFKLHSETTGLALNREMSDFPDIPKKGAENGGGYESDPHSYLKAKQPCHERLFIEILEFFSSRFVPTEQK